MADARRKGDDEIGGGGERYEGLKGEKSSRFTPLAAAGLGVVEEMMPFACEFGPAEKDPLLGLFVVLAVPNDELDELVDALELIEDIDVENRGRWGESLKTNEECLLDLAAGKNDDEVEDTDEWCKIPLVARGAGAEGLVLAAGAVEVAVWGSEAAEGWGDVSWRFEIEELAVEDGCRGGRDEAMIGGWRGDDLEGGGMSWLDASGAGGCYAKWIENLVAIAMQERDEQRKEEKEGRGRRSDGSWSKVCLVGRWVGDSNEEESGKDYVIAVSG